MYSTLRPVRVSALALSQLARLEGQIAILRKVRHFPKMPLHHRPEWA
jgi:hypothetical protein